jgi:hypothetical protein
VDDQTEHQWRPVFDGKTFKLGHGYFVVKTPNELDKKISNDEARIREMEFFRATPLWAEGLVDHFPRSGTATLRKYLSENLGSMMIQKHPRLDHDIETVSRTFVAPIEKYPTPPEDPLKIARETLQRFCDDSRQDIDRDFVQDARDLQNVWKKTQDALSQIMTPGTPQIDYHGEQDSLIFFELNNIPGTTSDDAFINDDDAVEEQSKEGNNTKNFTDANAETPRKKRRLDEDLQVQTATKTPTAGRVRAEANRTPGKVVSTGAKRTIFHELGVSHGLDKIQKELKFEANHKIDKESEHRLIDEIMLGAVQNCKGSIKEFFKQSVLLSGLLQWNLASCGPAS